MSYKGMQIAGQTAGEGLEEASNSHHLCGSLLLFFPLFYVFLLGLITVKGLKVVTVFIPNQWITHSKPCRPRDLHSIEISTLRGDQEDNVLHWCLDISIGNLVKSLESLGFHHSLRSSLSFPVIISHESAELWIWSTVTKSKILT